VWSVRCQGSSDPGDDHYQYKISGGRAGRPSPPRWRPIPDLVVCGEFNVADRRRRLGPAVFVGATMSPSRSGRPGRAARVGLEDV